MKIDLTDIALSHDGRVIWTRVYWLGAWTPFMRKGYGVQVPRELVQ